MLDHLYGQVAGARRRWYEQHPEARQRLRQPVISVGNVSVGGTGKTPLVGQIAQWLIARGERPAILSRGYQRQIEGDGVTIVADGTAVLADVAHAGDEPYMLACELADAIVCVAEDRHLAGAVAERVLGATVHILDDGFQHVRLARDFDILVTRPGEITRGRVLPSGRLRERRDAAARAHFVVVVGADRDAARSEAWELGISAFSSAKRKLLASRRSSPAPGWRAEGDALAVAGIGDPDQFFALLQSSGVVLKDTMRFADHHRYTPADIARIEVARRVAGAEIVVTTEKDAVRFAGAGTLPFPLVAVAMQLELDDWSGLTAALDAVLARRRGAA